MSNITLNPSTLAPKYDMQPKEPAAANFWTKSAQKYAKSPIANQQAYEHTLARTKSYLKPEHHMLELGCGTGSTALILAEHVKHLQATDFSKGMIDIAKQKQAELGVSNLDFAEKSVEDLPIYETYDVIFASSLLHLVDDVQDSLRRIADSLEPGGLFISKTACLKGKIPIFQMIVPLMQLIGKAPHVNFFSGAELEQMIVDAGFEIIEADDHNKGPNCRFIVAERI